MFRKEKYTNTYLHIFLGPYPFMTASSLSHSSIRVFRRFTSFAHLFIVQELLFPVSMSSLMPSMKTITSLPYFG
jgi:hypothetical protein